MPKSKEVASLSGMIDTDMEDDTLNADAFPTPDSNQENAAPARKKVGRAKSTAKRFTKSKAPTRTSGGSVAMTKSTALKSKTANKRAPLKEQINSQHADDAEEVDKFAAQPEGEIVMEDVAETKQPAKRKGPAKKGGRPPKKDPVVQMCATTKDGEFEYTPTAVRQTKGATKPVSSKLHKMNTSKRQASAEPRQPEKVIQETQVPMDIEESALAEEVEDEKEELPQSVFRRSHNPRANPRQRQPTNIRRRAASASDTERTAGDPATRRKLGEMTKKFESLELKYRNLREIGIKEAEANFEKLKVQSEAKAKAASDLINSLNKELATQKAIAQDSHSIQKQIASRDADLAKTQALADQLSNSLSEVQNENKALQAKLANSRSASIVVESLGSKTPGSAMKGKNQAQARTVMVGSAEAAHAAQIAQLKEDLYSDLTGLILRSVERSSESDVYDCIQTGRNGTLHFKLAVAKEADSSYENTEFHYTPRLDGNRDRDLIALLPEYLTDEITFSRTNAALFYGRVVETLTKRRVAEE